MNRLIAIIGGLLILTTGICQEKIDVDSINSLLTTHFQEYKPEISRFSGITMYGSTKSTFPKKQIRKELELYELIKINKGFENPSQQTFALCHNLIIHSNEIGIECFESLNKPTSDKSVKESLLLETLFLGEYGENIALKKLTGDNIDWKKVCGKYLGKFAIYEQSEPQIRELISSERNEDVQLYLLFSLMRIGKIESAEFVKDFIEATKSDKLQDAAIFVYAELQGFNSIEHLKKLKTVGNKSYKQRMNSIDWLMKNTSETNLYGTEIKSDYDFVKLFADIKTPSMIWMYRKGFLKEDFVNNPKQLSKPDKNELLDLLIESKGFGLEAIKGALFLSITPTDIDKLLEMRKSNFYSPSSKSMGRLKTIDMMIRYLRKQ